MRITEVADAATAAAPTPGPASDILALLTIDLAAIVANWRTMRARCGVETGAVIKADGYGVGAVPVGRALAAAGCRHFFVATLDEALALRAALPSCEIAVLNGMPSTTEPIFHAERLTPILNSIDEVTRWLAFAGGKGTTLPAMLHVDTGMNRLGLPQTDFIMLSEQPEVRSFPWRALISHFACSDEPHHPMNARQAADFAELRRRLPGVPGSLAATSGIFLDAAYQHDLTRPGVGLFGVNPHPGQPNPLAATVALAARILAVRDVDRNMSVGYGAAHTAELPSKIATIAVGYADGYPRSAGARGSMYLGGVAVPVVGRISMDLITLDVSRIPAERARPGAWVEIIGPHRTVDDVATDAGTIGYEILTSLGARYHRHYLGQD